MKILVMSDSHGAKNAMLQAVEKESPDYIMHLGDCDKDCAVIKAMHPTIPLKAVKGNCDTLSALPAAEEFMLEGKRFLMTHGHIFAVKSTLTRLMDYATEQGSEIVLYGHTHIPHKEQYNNILIVNPGSIGHGMPKKYAIIEINDGNVVCTHKSL